VRQRFFKFPSAFATVMVLVLGAMLPGVLLGQVSKGSISGNVVDAQGASVADADIKATSKDTSQEYATTSDSSGLFRLNLLPIGDYRLEVSKQGFRKFLFDTIDVAVGADRGLGAIKLELGDVTATVEVFAAPPLIESSEAQITNTFTAANISTFTGVLENQGLDFLALTIPGVVMSRDLGFSNTNGPEFAVNGLRGRSNDQQLDGQNNNDNSVGGPGLALSDSEFVSEYQITTSNFGAEYGRNSGSVVNVVTKSGTNNIHGSVYGTEGNSVLNSLSNTQKAFEGLTKPARFNDEFTGGTIGGPLWTDHLFFFGGLDDEIVSQSQVFSSGNLTPTPAGIATMVACYGNTDSLQALQTYGPYGIGGGNPTPQSPQLVDLATCPGVEMGGVQRTLSTGSKSYNFPIKLDLQTAKNRFYGRYLFNRSTFFNADSFGTAASGYPNSVPALAQDYAFSWARTISTRMSNEFRASYGRLNVQFGGNTIGNTVPNQQNVGDALAQVVFSDPSLLGYGPATNAPQGRIVNTYQLQDNWNYFRGRHSLKAGVNYTEQRSPNKFLPNLNGQFRFADWDAYGSNTPNRIRVASGDPNLNFRERDTFLYFGDDFKVRSNFTLNLGITWSYYGQPANLFHDKTVKEQTGPNPLWDPTLPLSVTTFPTIPAPKNSWGPSVGFAWTPGFGGILTGHGKTVLRGGYRLSYDPAYYNIYLNISSASPNVLLNTLTGPTAAGLPLLANPTGPNVRTQLAGDLLTGIFDPRSFNETSISPNFGPQRTHEWSFGLQREIVPGAVLEARYVGNHATKLFQSINGNPRIDGLAALYPNLVPAGLTPCPASDAAVPSAEGRVNCNEGIVRERSNTGYSDYNGLQVELRSNQLWRQLAMKTSYTFSKTTDNSSEIFATSAAGGTNAFSQSQVNFTGQEHGLSGLDFRHNFSVSLYEEIPAFRTQQGVLGHILGGWAVSGTYNIASGQPYTAVQAFLNCGSGGGACDGGGPTNPYDGPFDNAFIGADGALRPFLGSSSAPVSSVGIFAGDACNNFGVGCTQVPTTLLSLNTINQTINDPVPTETVVTNKDVRFIANGLVADQTFGTPFGSVGRNTLRDARTNIANFSLSKTVKVREQFKVVWHMTMLNAFNHPNFSSIDPFIEDAGLAQEGTGFANPSLFSGGLQTQVGTPGRSIRFGILLRW
jgi:hypothetical protein